MRFLCHTVKRIGIAVRPFAAIAAMAALSCPAARAADFDVAAYVWPAYQPDPRWAELGIFGDGKGEWQNLYEAVKRAPDDIWGVKPLWGYESDADPVAVARKIDAATAAGVNVFIYDWYWYGGRPFLEDALDKGFLGAKNSERMKFFIMYANHSVNGIWNNKISTADGKNKVVWPAKITDEDWREIVDRWIAYFKRPNYYKIDGRPVLSIYMLGFFINWDGLDKAKERLAFLRERVKAVGFPGLHLQATLQGYSEERKDQYAALGVDSATCYNMGPKARRRIANASLPEPDYAEICDTMIGELDELRDRCGAFGATYVPVVAIGWDNNARYPVGETKRRIRNQSPEKFEHLVRRTCDWADANLKPPMSKLVIVNSWNEWTEGGYLEPDDRFGYGFLDALRRVFVK